VHPTSTRRQGLSSRRHFVALNSREISDSNSEFS
jgi:hypothetical protein